MRFRKRVSLGKGMNLNLSKSGASFTGGVKGLSMSVGGKGTYLNTSIPGTGIYNRTKIGGGSKKKSRSSYSQAAETHRSVVASSQSEETIHLNVNLKYNEDGTVTCIDPSGHEITNPTLLKQIKSSTEYKAELARMTAVRIKEYEDEMSGIIDIQKQTPKVLSTEEWKKWIFDLQPRQYTPKLFSEPQPSMDDVVLELTEEAERNIEGWWKRKKMIQRYVYDTKTSEYDDRYRAWQTRKNTFLKQEEQAKREFDIKEQNALEERRIQYLRLIQGNEPVVDRVIDHWLSTVEIPLDFDLEYEHAGNDLFVDLDLPEIEDFPDMKVQKMANGTAKIKPKSKKEIKEDYSKCVYGMAIFFAGNIFNKALGVDRIIVSGYTQRRNKSGDIFDDYIFSIVFDRNTFKTLDYNNDSCENCMIFNNRVLQNADKGFKSIEPYSIEDVQEID